MRIGGIRTRLLIVIVATVAIGLAAATLAFDTLLGRSVAHNVDALLRQRIASELSVLTVRGGHIVKNETGGDRIADGRIWIYQGQRPIEVARARPETEAAARRAVGGPRRFIDVPPTDERLYAVPLRDSFGRRVGTVVAGLSTAPYEDTLHAAFIGAVIFAFGLLTLVAGASWWLLRAALRPVALMTAQADAWSEQELDRRFDVQEPDDELSQLAATLNRLIDRIAASLRHERRFTSELSHEIRTPLSKVIAEAELALRRDRSPDEYRTALGLVARNATQVARIVDTLVAAARHEAGAASGTADATDVADDVVAALSELASERGVVIRMSPPAEPLRVGIDGDLAARAVQPVVENACRYSRSLVTIDIEPAGGSVAFVVRDDGPGVAADEVERVFEPGTRGTAADGVPGAGLGLALARRIARTVTGEVEVLPGEGGGFVVTLPGA